jgi:hypothetical protein
MRQHARLFYVMRIGDRASVRRVRLVVKNVDAAGLRIARMAYDMHY